MGKTKSTNQFCCQPVTVQQHGAPTTAGRQQPEPITAPDPERSQLVVMKSWVFGRPPSFYHLQNYLKDQVLSLKKEFKVEQQNRKSGKEWKGVRQDENWEKSCNDDHRKHRDGGILLRGVVCGDSNTGGEGAVEKEQRWPCESESEETYDLQGYKLNLSVWPFS